MRITVLERASLLVEGTVEASVVIEAGVSRLEVPQGSVVLLPEGWRAVGVVWKGALQTQAPPDAVPAGEGTYRISLSRRTVRVVNGAENLEGWSTTGWDGVAVLSVVGEVDKWVEVPGGSVRLGPEEEEVTVRTSDGFYSLAAIAFAVLAVPYALLTPRSPPPQRRG